MIGVIWANEHARTGGANLQAARTVGNIGITSAEYKADALELCNIYNLKVASFCKILGARKPFSHIIVDL